MNMFFVRRTDGKREWRYRTSMFDGVKYYYFYLGPYTLNVWWIK